MHVLEAFRVLVVAAAALTAKRRLWSRVPMIAGVDIVLMLILFQVEHFVLLLFRRRAAAVVAVAVDLLLQVAQVEHILLEQVERIRSLLLLLLLLWLFVSIE